MAKMVKMLANVIIKGKPAYEGEIVEVDDADCRTLLNYKQAEVYTEPIKPIKKKGG